MSFAILQQKRAHHFLMIPARLLLHARLKVDTTQYLSRCGRFSLSNPVLVFLHVWNNHCLNIIFQAGIFLLLCFADGSGTAKGSFTIISEDTISPGKSPSPTGAGCKRTALSICLNLVISSVNVSTPLSSGTEFHP